MHQHEVWDERLMCGVRVPDINVGPEPRQPSVLCRAWRDEHEGRETQYTRSRLSNK